MPYINPPINHEDFEGKPISNAENEFSFTRLIGNTNFEELLNVEKVKLIAGEAGLGKTRLLQEVAFRKFQQGNHVIFIDLKAIEYKRIEEYIVKEIDFYDELEEIDLSAIDFEKSFKTKDFKLENKRTTTVVLDALDEVDYHKIGERISSILKFNKKYNKIDLWISYRSYLIDEFKDQLISLNPSLYQLKKFGKPLIFETIKAYFDEIHFEKIKHWEYELEYLQIPRFLFYTIHLIKKEGLESVQHLTRAEITERFVFHDLEKVIEKHKPILQPDEVERICEELAVILEVKQTTQFTKEEHLDILNNVDSNISPQLIGKRGNWFYQSLFVSTRGKLHFKDATIQKYLAAKNLYSYQNLENIVARFCVEPNARLIRSNWYEVLNFLFEFKPNLKTILLPQLEMVFDDGIIEILLSPYSIPSDENKRNNIFKVVFDGFNENYRDIRYTNIPVADYLSKYVNIEQFTRDFELFLKQESYQSEHIIRNYLCIASTLASQSKMDLSAYHESLFQLFHQFPKQSGIILHSIQFSVAKNEKALVDLATETYDKCDKHSKLQIRQLLTEYIPNHSLLVSYIIETLDKEHNEDFHGLHKVEIPKQIAKILSAIQNLDAIKTSKIFKYYVGNNDGENKVDFLYNVKKYYDKSFYKILHQILIKCLEEESFSAKSDELAFYDELFKFLLSKNDNYLIEFLDAFNKPQKIYFSGLFSTFASVIKPNQLDFWKAYFMNPETGLSIETARLKSNLEENPYKLELLSILEKMTVKEEAYWAENNKNRKLEEKRWEIEKQEKQNEWIKEEKNKHWIYKIEQILRWKSTLFDDELPHLIEFAKMYLESRKPILEFCNITKFENFENQYSFEAITQLSSIHFLKRQDISIIPYLHLAVDLLFLPFGVSFDTNENKLFETKDKAELIEPRIQFLSKNLDKKWAKPFVEPALKFVNYPVHYSHFKKLYEFYLQEITENRHEDTFSEKADEYSKFFDDEAFLLELFHSNKLKTQEKFEIAKKVVLNFKNIELTDWLVQAIIDNKAKRKKQKTGVTSAFISIDKEYMYRESSLVLANTKNPAVIQPLTTAFEDAVKLYEKDEEYFRYMQYIYETLCNCLQTLETQNKEHISGLETIFEQSKTARLKLYQHFQRVRNIYYSNLSVAGNFIEATKIYNNIKENSHLPVQDDFEFQKFIENILENEFRQHIIDSGIYGRIEAVAKGKMEKDMQSQMCLELENYFLRIGINKNDIYHPFRITKEEETPSGKFTDFYIYNYFGKPIMIEIKRSVNDDISRKDKIQRYKSKLKEYIAARSCCYGFLVVFNTYKTKKTFDDKMKMIRDVYKDFEDLTVIGYDKI